MAVSQNQGERMLTLCIGVSESERKGEGTNSLDVGF